MLGPFHGLIANNAEGKIVCDDSARPGAAAIPFTSEGVERYAGDQPMQAHGAALLRLAWHHRHELV